MCLCVSCINSLGLALNRMKMEESVEVMCGDTYKAFVFQASVSCLVFLIMTSTQLCGHARLVASLLFLLLYRLFLPNIQGCPPKAEVRDATFKLQCV